MKAAWTLLGFLATGNPVLTVLRVGKARIGQLRACRQVEQRQHTAAVRLQACHRGRCGRRAAASKQREVAHRLALRLLASVVKKIWDIAAHEAVTVWLRHLQAARAAAATTIQART